MNRPLVINGKFTAQRLTGVQRVAEQLVRALDERPDLQGVTLLLPPQGRRLDLRRIAERTVGPAGWPLHAWEQLVLPRAARGSLLLNLAGGAPAFGARQVSVLHDAVLFDRPKAYSISFALWYRWLFRRLARHAHHLLTVSRFSQTRLSCALGLESARLVVMHNGVDHIDMHALPSETLERELACHGLVPGGYLLAVGSSNPNKNLDRLRHAYAGLPLHRHKLVLVGGEDGAVFSSNHAALAPGEVRLGAVEDETLRALYQGARALVFPSLYEGFGLPPLEAMASGCAVISSTAGALPEVCGDAALYVDPYDVPALTNAMRRVCEDDFLHAHLVKAGRLQAAKFRWADAAQTLIEVIEMDGACS